MPPTINRRTSSAKYILRLTVMGALLKFTELASLRIQTPNYTNGRKAQEIISGVTSSQGGDMTTAPTNPYPGDPYRMNCCPTVGTSVTPDTSCCQTVMQNSGSMYSNTMCCPATPIQLLTLTPYETKNVTLTAPTEVLLTIRVTPLNGAHHNLPEFRLEVLNSHNEKRSIHEAPPLTIDQQLNRAAQSFANSMALQRKVAQSPQETRPGQGESVAQQCRSNGLSAPAGGNMTDMWYKEVENYDWQTPGYAQNTAHFSQMVWKATTKLGVGFAQYKKDGETCYVAVARYTPRGNSPGQFQDNVLKGIYITKRHRIPSLLSQDLFAKR